MKEQPILETPRLRLRPFTLDDAPAILPLAGALEIAMMTLNMPHPYEEGMAEQWIGTHQGQWEEGKAAIFAVTLRESGTLIGVMGLGINANFHHAELGYWIGVPYWGQGYATEAGLAVLGFGFETLGLHRVHAAHFAMNPASGRVMAKIGMQYEGCLREHYCKWGQFQDSVRYGILASEWNR